MDLTLAAVPGYFATMGAEYMYMKKQAETREPTAGDYERQDTIASLAMGVGSILAPLTITKLANQFTPGKGRYAKALIIGTVGAAVVATVADRVVAKERSETIRGCAETQSASRPSSRPTFQPASTPSPRPTSQSSSQPASSPSPRPTFQPASLPSDPPADPSTNPPSNRAPSRRVQRSLAKRIASSAGVVAVSGAVLAASTAWASRTAANRLFDSHQRDLGDGPLATLGAVLGWDFIYYWNHRLMHETRWLWAIHVVHHSSEHYNLSTALRQPVLDVFGMFVPYGLLSLVGFRPESIETARGVNLLYQYWIHTETIPKLGPVEEVFNTASHHRVHHGSNRQYLDRNHGSILIIWDRLFGTFEREQEPVIYGLTKNINTFDPLKIATHEHEDILKDVAASNNWRERLNFVFRGPGWAYEAHARGLGAPQA